jgi:hypothetical protein
MARQLGLAAFVVAALGTTAGGANIACAQSADGPSVYRTWLNDSRKAHIQIGPCSDAASGPVCGRIVRLLEPKKADGSPGTQEEAVNACDVKAGRPPRKLLGMAVLSGFKPGAGNAAITGGKAYNVEDCDMYSIDATAVDGGRALELRHWTGMKRTWTLVR